MGITRVVVCFRWLRMLLFLIGGSGRAGFMGEGSVQALNQLVTLREAVPQNCVRTTENVALSQMRSIHFKIPSFIEETTAAAICQNSRLLSPHFWATPFGKQIWQRYIDTRTSLPSIDINRDFNTSPS